MVAVENQFSNWHQVTTAESLTLRVIEQGCAIVLPVSSLDSGKLDKLAELGFAISEEFIDVVSCELAKYNSEFFLSIQTAIKIHHVPFILGSSTHQSSVLLDRLRDIYKDFYFDLFDESRDKTDEYLIVWYRGHFYNLLNSRTLGSCDVDDEELDFEEFYSGMFD